MIICNNFEFNDVSHKPIKFVEKVVLRDMLVICRTNIVTAEELSLTRQNFYGGFRTF